MSTIELTHDEVEALFHLAFIDSLEWLQKATDEERTPADRAIYHLVYEDRKALRHRLEALRTPKA